MVLEGGRIWQSYILTITMTLVGTFLGLMFIAMAGYALQRRDFPFRNAISFYIYFTSLFSAGLAPYYLTMTQRYHLRDSYLAVLIPLLMSPWLVILMKNTGLPASLNIPMARFTIGNIPATGSAIAPRAYLFWISTTIRARDLERMSASAIMASPGGSPAEASTPRPIPRRSP